jgi:ketosteroid isomerase-like protein
MPGTGDSAGRRPGKEACLSQDIEGAVLAAERRRCEAMLANDSDALAALLDPRLHFSHATGAVDDRDALLAKMAAGRIRYVDVAWAEEQVTALGPDAAMLTGRMTTDVEVEGVAKRLDNRVITVWTKGARGRLLLALQTTPIAG